MRAVRFFALILLSLTLAACSKSGSGGAGSADDGLGEGNIPLAQPGGELPDVHFEFDSYSLTGRSQAMLSDSAKWLMDNPGSKVTLEGHCDERGTNEYNMALGERRAQAVFSYLRSLGIESSQLATISYGEELPLDPNSNESAWSKNRRVHFAIR